MIKPIDVQCPQCRARPGEPCVRVDGGGIRVPNHETHKRRIKAAEKKQ